MKVRMSWERVMKNISQFQIQEDFLFSYPADGISSRSRETDITGASSYVACLSPLAKPHLPFSPTQKVFRIRMANEMSDWFTRIGR